MSEIIKRKLEHINRYLEIFQIDEKYFKTDTFEHELDWTISLKDSGELRKVVLTNNFPIRAVYRGIRKALEEEKTRLETMLGQNPATDFDTFKGELRTIHKGEEDA